MNNTESIIPDHPIEAINCGPDVRPFVRAALISLGMNPDKPEINSIDEKKER